jgi:hypothetical protein
MNLREIGWQDTDWINRPRRVNMWGGVECSENSKGLFNSAIGGEFLGIQSDFYLAQNTILRAVERK